MDATGLPPRDRALYRVLYKRLRLPRTLVHNTMGALRRRRLGPEIEQRQALLQDFQPGPLALDPDTGWRFIDRGESAELTELAERCGALFESFRDEGHADEVLARNPSKRFLLGVRSGNELLAHPELVKLMVARPIVDAAAHYLGSVPRLEGAVLWWTPPNASQTSSQCWHIDELARRQVKILLNCSEVTADCGPVHFLPGDRSDKLREQMRHKRGRVSDEDLMALAGPEEIRQAIGPPGSEIMLDSSRCLHFGSRANERDRLVLAFHFFAADAPVDSRYHLELDGFTGPYAELDPIQRLALGRNTVD